MSERKEQKEMTEDEKRQFEQYIANLRDALGTDKRIDKIEKQLQNIIDFIKPDTEGGHAQEKNQGKKLRDMDAMDTLEFMHEVVKLGKEANLIKPSSDPYTELIFKMGLEYADIMRYQFMQSSKEFQSFKSWREGQHKNEQ